jgi:hypothetical protein
MMFRAVTTGLLLRCLLLSFADIPSKANTEPKDESSKARASAATAAGQTSTFTCPDGWVHQQSEKESSCLLLDREARDYPDSQIHCKKLGGWLVTFPDSDKETYVKALGGAADGVEFWVGLYKGSGYTTSFQWQEPSEKVTAYDDKLSQAMRDYQGYSQKCGYVDVPNNALEMDECRSEYSALCETQISCKPGYFGHRCEKECHCAGEPCNPSGAPGYTDISCKWGCLNNWMGESCDKVKQDPEVRYFCVNSPEEGGKYVHIRLYSKGVYYRAVYGLFANKTVGTWCSTTTFDFNSYPEELGIIKIPIDNASIAEMSEGKCCGEKLRNDVYSWTIVVKEYPGLLLEHDVMVNVTCDFSEARSLFSSGTYNLEGSKPHHIHETEVKPEGINNDVRLVVINLPSGDRVHEVNIGTPVALQLNFGIQEGSLLRGVFPYKCAASTADGKQVRMLLDKNGCPVESSPISSFQKVNDTLVTPVFNVFAFEGDTGVTFQCYLELCFTSDCNVGCTDSRRYKRDTRDRKEDDQYMTTSTIRVLPSIKSQKRPGTSHNQEYQPGPAPGTSLYEAGPFVYLNPVTCTLFLVILLVFFCMYIAFLRTLRKSIYDIRKEIEVKRSRDKFLHCGCVQQKDRAVLQA